jgi:hypothetical protein
MHRSIRTLKCGPGESMADRAMADCHWLRVADSILMAFSAITDRFQGMPFGMAVDASERFGIELSIDSKVIPVTGIGVLVCRMAEKTSVLSNFNILVNAIEFRRLVLKMCLTQFVTLKAVNLGMFFQLRDFKIRVF